MGKNRKPESWEEYEYIVCADCGGINGSHQNTPDGRPCPAHN